MSGETEAAANGALTAAEQAYFDSRGAKTEGLDAGAAAADPAPKLDPAPKTAAEGPKADAAAVAAKTGADTDPDEEPLGEDGRPKNPGRFIRFGAFDKERARRKEVEQQLEQERTARAKDREERVKVQERLELLNAALAPQKTATEAAPPAEPPDPEKDIFGYAKWQGEQLAALTKRLDEVNGQVGKVQQTSAAQVAEINLKSAYVHDAQRFEAVQPDFVSAYRHIWQSRDQQLAHLGNADPKSRAAIIAAEERDIVHAALKAGVSPAERIYGLAKHFGYVAPAADGKANGGAAAPAGGGNGAAAGGANGAAATTTNGNGLAGAGNGAAANGGAAPAAATSSVTEEIDRIKRGQDASKSLSQAGGTAGGALTMEALANMPQDEFNAWLAKASKSQIRAVMGG